MTRSLFSQLVPVPQFELGFTTCEAIASPLAQLVHVELADKPLGVHKVSSRTPHNVVCPAPPRNAAPALADGFANPIPSAAWEAFYPLGSCNPSSAVPGGFGFYLAGPPEFAKRLETAKEAVFSYRMMLDEDWEWVKGGKLPGVFGGVGSLSYGCTGGRQEQRCQCFNLRPMWRSKGVGELYAYLPLSQENGDVLEKVPPLSTRNNDYGFSVGRGALDLNLAVGKWIAIAFRLKLNTPGCRDGEIEIWLDGESVINIKDVSLLEGKDSEDGKLKGMHFQTFFGGHTQDWASTRDQRAWFADVTGVIVS